ncbi:MAG: xanthine dehydrogenase family protein molybdopterin-binding subunit [Acidobacteriota bacterium]
MPEERPRHPRPAPANRPPALPEPAPEPRSEYVTSEIEIEGNTLKTVARNVPQLPPWQKPQVVGKRHRRVDAYEKVTGRARFTTDIRRPRMLYGAFLRSPLPNLKVRRLDLEAARRLPGVRVVLSPEDVREYGYKDQALLTLEPRYAGQEIAAVAAVDEASARAAVAAIRIEYEEGPFVIDPLVALRPDAPELYPGGNYTTGGWFGDKKPGERSVYTRGDAERGLSDSTLVIERSFTTPAVLHSCMEPHATVAEWNGDRLTVWESTQGVFAVQEDLAEILKLPLTRIRVIATHMGGGFGSKNSAQSHCVLAALLARRAGRPVRVELSRREEQRSPWYRPSTIQEIKAGFNADGTLQALDLKAYIQAGAYLHTALWSCSKPVQELYRCPNVRTEEYNVLTHLPSPAAMRGPGNTEGAWALEQVMDEAAHRLGLDPVELRLRNIPTIDPVTGNPYASHGLQRCLEEGARRFGWAKRRLQPVRKGSKWRGVGVACPVWGGGGGPPSKANVEVHQDGSILIYTGAADIGTGTRTVLTQIVAEELRVPMEWIEIINADTARTPYALPSYGSITLASNGPAVRTAAHDVLREMARLAAHLFEVAPGEIEVVEREFRVRTAPERKFTWKELARRFPSRSMIGKGERGPNPEQVTLRTFGAQFCEVEVDVETGEVRVTDFLAAHDSGQVINRSTWESQIQGGVCLGMGYALTERRILDEETGVQINPRFADYKPVTIADMPGRFEIVDTQVPYEANHIGAKGIGEPATIATAPAIANAVAHATGLRISENPILPSRLIEKLEEKSRA